MGLDMELEQTESGIETSETWGNRHSEKKFREP
jgi:hypothetical protein